MLNWLRPFSIFCYLDNQQYTIAPHQTDCLVAAGAQAFIEGQDISVLDAFVQRHPWVFGHLSYELKNVIHPASQVKEDKVGFPPYFFFAPEIILEIRNNKLSVHATGSPADLFNQINACSEDVDSGTPPVANPQPILSREEYLQKIRALQDHIHRGDCYEINFCQQFTAEGAQIDPFACFHKLMEVSPNPFSAFYRLHDKYLLCASPERFLARKGAKIFSQPIKGTIRRNLVSVEEDEKLKQELLHRQKEQSENVMVVDLVRNDLTRICRDATVKVDELFGIYSFPQVHQMISTISGELREDVSFADIIRATFPMGSMTGAPKHRVLQLIDEYEPTARGIFSGAVGYFNPDKDFDFNVVIRSIMYNSTREYLSYHVGSGITFYSEAEKEWEECLLKAEAIRQVLS